MCTPPLIQRICLLSLASLLITSCTIFGPDFGGTVTTTLRPEQVSIDDQLSLKVDNSTDEAIWYHCGYGVEKLEGSNWQKYTATGCIGTEMPVKIEPGASHTDQVGLFVHEAGTYRIKAHLTDGDKSELADAARTTNAVVLVD